MDGTLRALKVLREGSDREIEKLYSDLRPRFIAVLVKKFGASESQAVELYQNAFCILWEQCDGEKIQSISGSIDSYLIGIGKNVLREERRKTSDRLTPLDNVKSPSDNEMMESMANLGGDGLLEEAFDRLGDRCKNVLKMYYYREFNMESIASRMGLKNTDVAKKTKYECLKKMREIYLELTEKNETNK